MAEDLFTQYENVRTRVSALARTLSDDDLATTVKATPLWTVRDLVGHIAGVCEDLPNGNFPSGNGAAWTQAQVDRWRAKSLDELADGWAQASAGFAPKVEELGALAGIIVADAAIHEQDLRNAIGRGDGGDNPECAGLLAFFTPFLGGRLAKAGAPALRLVTGSTELIAGEGEPGATVTASQYDLTRALVGRRTLDEIRAFDWDGDPEAYLPHISGFPPPAASLGE